jgi:hypothetical protein
MGNQLDWQTEEDDGWEVILTSETEAAGGRGRSWPKYLLAGLLLFGLLGLVVYSLLNRQVSATNDETSAGVLASQSLLKRASTVDDVDLFDSLLSPEYWRWRRLHLTLFREGLMLDRPTLGLDALPNLEADSQSGEIEIELSADLTQADVEEPIPYLAQHGGTAGPFQLISTTRYIRDQNGWRLMPLPEDESFWGPWINEVHGPLTAIFPERDEALGRRLSQDIAALIEDICADAEVECPPGFRLEFELAISQQSLLSLNTNYRSDTMGGAYLPYRIILPAPTLVGRPVDEAGYQALYRCYSGWVAAVLTNRYLRGPRSSDDASRIEKKLASWDLQSPPMPDAAGPLPSASKEPPPIPFPEETALLICNGHTPQKSLLYDLESDIWGAIPEIKDAPDLAHLLASTQPPSRFPPDGQGILIRRPRILQDISYWQSYLWLGGLDNLLEEESRADIYLADPLQVVQDAPGLTFYRYSGQSDKPVGQALVLDLPACLNGECRLQDTGGRQVTSPDGQKTLVEVVDAGGRPILYLRDASGSQQRLIGPGYAPLWLDERRFAFARLAQPSPSGRSPGNVISELLVGRINESGLLDNVEVLLASEILLDALATEFPETNRPDQLVITSIRTHPLQPEWWFISTTTSTQASQPETEARDYLFAFNRIYGTTVTLPTPQDMRLALPIHVTSDGRFLSLLGFEPGSSATGDWSLIVLNLDPIYGGTEKRGNRPAVFSIDTDSGYYDWSADEEWLMLAEDGELRFISTRYNYSRRVPHGLDCHAAGWVAAP